jgi:hypothetical protein
MLLWDSWKRRSVSVPITKWETSRCVKADITWVVLKTGFSGV